MIKKIFSNIIFLLLISIIISSLLFGAKSCSSRGGSKTKSGSSDYNTFSINAPSELTATAVTFTQVDLFWQDNSNNEDGFEIERSTSAEGGPTSGWALLDTLSTNTTSYSDMTVSASTTYYYRVRVFNSIGDRSEYSNIASVLVFNWDWLPRFISVDVGDFHTIAMESNGAFWVWGLNTGGQLGLGDADNRFFPTPMGTETNWAAMAAGGYHTLALKTDPAGGGTLWAWGSNFYGQLGMGTVQYDNWEPWQVGNDLDWSQLTAGYSHSIALKTNGTLWGWGYNFLGELGPMPGGSDYILTPTQIGTDSDWDAVIADGDASGGHNLARKTNGTIWSWGQKNLTKLPPACVGTDSDWSMLAAGADHKLVLKINPTGGGTLWSWGSNSYGQLGLADNINRDNPAQIGITSDWFFMSAGSYHSVAIKTNRTAWTWGYNEFSQLGLGDTINRDIPTQVGTDLDWSIIAAGGGMDYLIGGHCIGIKTNGTLWAWGSNDYGQLGFGDTINRNIPCLLGSPTPPSSLNAIAVSSSQINLSWIDNSPNETGFRIERSTDGNNYLLLTTINSNTTSYSDTGLPSLTIYYYRVQAFNSTAGDSSYSNETNGTTQTTIPPTAPTELTATAVSYSQIDLSWTNISAEDGYKIERAFISGGPYTQIATTVTDVITYSDTIVTPLNTYYYQVRAFNAAGYSDYSPEANAATPQAPPNAPNELTAVVISANLVIVTWTNVADETGYEIERKFGASGTYIPIATIDTNVITYNDSTVTPSNTYYYQVRAFNAAGYSDYSPNASAMPVSAPPEAPATSTAVATAYNVINLSWTNVADEISYHIERKFGASGTYIPIATTNTDIVTYNDTAVTSSNTYYYQVRAFNAAGYSDYSPETNATTPEIPPDAPITITAVAISSTRIDLSWTDVISETDYKIECKLGHFGTYIQIGTTTGDVVTYSDTTVTPYNTYYYRVRAHNIGGDSFCSPEVYLVTVGKWSLIAAGGGHSLGLKTTGTLWVWGNNGYGQLGLGDNDNRITPSQVGTSSDWSIITAMGEHSASIKTDNTLWVWGRNDNGELGLGGVASRDIPSQVGTSSDWSKIACAMAHTISIKTNGTIWSCGTEMAGELGLGDGVPFQTISNFTQIGTDSDWFMPAVGETHSIALKTNGTIWAWGGRAFGVGPYSQLGLGDIVNRNIPTQIGTNSDWSTISAGEFYSVAIKNNRSIWAWGRNVEGQLGLGDTIERFTPSIIGIDLDWSFITASDSSAHTVAIKTNPAGGGTLWSWGSNDYGQLGLGNNTAYRITPTQIGINSDWSTIDAGGAWNDPSNSSYNLAIKTNRTLWVWGYNGYGQLGLWDNIDRYAPTLVEEYNPESITLPGTPTALTAQAISSSQIALTWTNVAIENGYYVERGPGASGPWMRIVTATADTTNYNDTGLSANTAYYYQVCAYNLGGSSNYTAANATTSPNPPNAPGSLTATALSSTQIALTWPDVANETGYKIERKIDEGGTYAQIATVAFDVISYSDNTLSELTTYYYRVKSYNSGGDSLTYSPPASATTLSAGTPPEAPDTLTATAISSTQISLLWTNVTNENGYKIERKFGAGGTYIEIATTATDVITYNDSTVTPSNNYYYQVRAWNGQGDSGYSPAANTTTPPDAPSALTATTISSTQISLLWTNVSGEDGYEIERKFGEGGTYAYIATTGTDIITYSDTVVTGGNTYYYQVCPYNAGGNGNYSPSTNATTPPDAPSALTATTISSTQISLTWTNVSGEDGYRIERKFGAGGTYIQIATTGTDIITYSDTVVTGGNTYYYQVCPYNAGGNGNYSPSANATTPPDAPASLNALAISSTQISLSWTNVNGETSYKIERSTDGSSYSQIGTTAVDVITYLNTGLSLATKYWYKVKASNTSGDSNYSPVANATTWPNVGNGADGTGTVSANTNLNTSSICGRGTPDMISFVVTGTVNAGASSLAVTATPTGLAANDEVIIINLKGTITDSTYTGLYEFKRIQSISAMTITFTSAISNTYGNAATGQRIMLQRVPNYTNVTINSGVSMTISSWNGITGGVLAFRANGTVTVNGANGINIIGKGFRGGASTIASQNANGGESYNGFAGAGGKYNTAGITGTGGGGGGGSNDSASYNGAVGQAGSGGGGGGAVSGTESTSLYFGSGGGGGAYGNSMGTGGTASVWNGVDGGTPNGGDGGNGYLYFPYLANGGGGGGGGIIGNSAALNQRAYLGGGGGAGGGAIYSGTNAVSGAGGNGGGILFIAAATITVVSGASITANGGDGAVGDETTVYSIAAGGGGGAGAGGSIILFVGQMINSNEITAYGGPGIPGEYGYALQGGNGGGGRTYARYGSLTGNAPVPNYSGP
jgi:alpha-tubulin suppressor-like RCC1 family protein